VTPEKFKDLLVRYGFTVTKTTEHNWTLFKADAARPVITLPRHGELVSLTIMMGVLDQLKIDNSTYFSLLNPY
jgi:hypothetical protein